MSQHRPFHGPRWFMLSAILVPFAAGAVHLNYEVDLGIEHNDNVAGTENNRIGEDILRPALGFSLDEQGSTVQANATGLFEYRDYLGGQFSDEFRSQLSGRLNWSMIPERLNWTVEDYLGVQPINTLQANTPSNLQQINVLALGPTLNFRIGPTVRGQAELRYINSYAEETADFNTQRLSAALRAIKDLSVTSALSANLTGERIGYNESDVGPDYDRYSVFGRYTHAWNKVNLSSDVGYSWLRYTGNAASVFDRDDPLLRTDVSYRATDRSTFSANLAYQYSDTGSGLLQGNQIGNTVPAQIATGNASVTSAAYVQRRLGAGYTWTGSLLTLTVSPYYEKLSYINALLPGDIGTTGLDQSGRGGFASLSWRLRQSLTFGFNANGERLRYNDIARTDKTWQLQAFVRQQWSRHWSGRAELTHYERDSDAIDQSNKQNIAYFGVTYTR